MNERGAGVGPGETLRLRLVVNRRPVELLVPPHRTLLEVLREDLALTGTKHGCDLGESFAATGPERPAVFETTFFEHVAYGARTSAAKYVRSSTRWPSGSSSTSGAIPARGRR